MIYKSKRQPVIKIKKSVPKYPSDNDIITVHTGPVTGPGVTLRSRDNRQILISVIKLLRFSE